ncbi:hypothetical protein DFH06DRAFT_1138394 [Mycena polygramma]|nr:hypothetical protein DFH06DRAFT_1138394 [Mycena polygramma]
MSRGGGKTRRGRKKSTIQTERPFIEEQPLTANQSPTPKVYIKLPPPNTGRKTPPIPLQRTAIWYLPGDKRAAPDPESSGSNKKQATIMEDALKELEDERILMKEALSKMRNSSSRHSRFNAAQVEHENGLLKKEIERLNTENEELKKPGSDEAQDIDRMYTQAGLDMAEISTLNERVNTDELMIERLGQQVAKMASCTLNFGTLHPDDWPGGDYHSAPQRGFFFLAHDGQTLGLDVDRKASRSTFILCGLNIIVQVDRDKGSGSLSIFSSALHGTETRVDQDVFSVGLAVDHLVEDLFDGDDKKDENLSSGAGEPLWDPTSNESFGDVASAPQKKDRQSISENRPANRPAYGGQSLGHADTILGSDVKKSGKADETSSTVQCSPDCTPETPSTLSADAASVCFDKDIELDPRQAAYFKELTSVDAVPFVPKAAFTFVALPAANEARVSQNQNLVRPEVGHLFSLLSTAQLTVPQLLDPPHLGAAGSRFHFKSEREEETYVNPYQISTTWLERPFPQPPPPGSRPIRPLPKSKSGRPLIMSDGTR